MVNPKQATTEHGYISPVCNNKSANLYLMRLLYFGSLFLVHFCCSWSQQTKILPWNYRTKKKKNIPCWPLLGILDPSQSVTSCACNKRSRVQRSIGWRQNCPPKSLAVELSNNTYQRWCKHNFNIILYQVVTMPSSDSNKLILRSWHKKGYSGIENPLNKTHKQRNFFFFNFKLYFTSPVRIFKFVLLNIYPH